MLLVGLDFCAYGEAKDIAEIDRLSHKSPWSALAIGKDLLDSSRGAVYLGARKDGVLVGYIVLERRCPHMWILRLSVHPDWRNLGIGGQLLTGAEVIGEEWGCRRVGLSVRFFNSSAISFYEGWGFVRTSKLLSYYGDGEDALRMERSLLL